jgi:hypothetical protein
VGVWFVLLIVCMSVVSVGNLCVRVWLMLEIVCENVVSVENCVCESVWQQHKNCCI